MQWSAHSLLRRTQYFSAHSTVPMATAQRCGFISGVVSQRVPRGLTALPLRSSDEVVEELAEAYIHMDLSTMSEFHRRAIAEMHKAVAKTPTANSTNEVVGMSHYEDQLLHYMGGGSGAMLASSAAAAAPLGTTAASPNSSMENLPAAPSAKKAVEKTAFDISLKSFPAENKIRLIKELRGACGLSIPEAKGAIERSPGVIARHLQKSDAEKLKEAMGKLGAEVELV